MSAQPQLAPPSVDQRVYDLYDEYCHGRILSLDSRRRGATVG
jgi:hypothetical protein